MQIILEILFLCPQCILLLTQGGPLRLPFAQPLPWTCPWHLSHSRNLCPDAPAVVGFWDPDRKEGDLMASLESSRTLGSRRRVTVMPGLSPTGVSAYAGDDCDETVHTGEGSTPPYSSDSSPYSCSTKKQRTDETLSSEHRAAPLQDHAAPQDYALEGTYATCQPVSPRARHAH